jgi:hypothetical protein
MPNINKTIHPKSLRGISKEFIEELMETVKKGNISQLKPYTKNAQRH